MRRVACRWHRDGRSREGLREPRQALSHYDIYKNCPGGRCYSRNKIYEQWCVPTCERMIIVGMDPSLRTIWRATCVYNGTRQYAWVSQGGVQYCLPFRWPIRL